MLTFDWNQIAFIGSPLATPCTRIPFLGRHVRRLTVELQLGWAEANIAVGFIFFFCAFLLSAFLSLVVCFLNNVHPGILTPIFYYTGQWHSQYLPMSSRLPFDNMGQQYNISRILRADSTIDLEAFRAYSPLYLSCVDQLCASDLVRTLNASRVIALG